MRKQELVNLKKAQCESCELSFIWGKMRAAAWEITPQTAPKRRGESQHICDFGEGGIHAIKFIFFQKASDNFVKLSAHHKEQSS